MKKTFSLLSFSFILSLGLLISTVKVFANNEKPVKAHPVQVEVKYVGTVKESPVLRLSFKNEPVNISNITLTDLYGNILFSEPTYGKNFSKDFQFEDHNYGNIDLKVILSTKNGSNYTEIFQVARTSRVVEEVEVRKF